LLCLCFGVDDLVGEEKPHAHTNALLVEGGMKRRRGGGGGPIYAT